MSFSISGIFKPAKQTEPVSNLAPKADDTNATETKAPQAENTAKKEGNGGSCCGGCGGGNH
ncbi:CCGSCS motif protein [Shewanella sp. S1-49-MNA-CIBAN-0167]|uniref:CCGSCS motif protein n=1 Tax=Shewanella sp. S1-49-MNA-CIBAN-0167 TaxID=3140468 RepID=UPI003324FC28